MSNCPLCKLELKVTGNLAEDGYSECPTKHYSYEHSYGGHRETFSAWDGTINAEFMWHYTEKKEDREVREQAIKGFTAYVRSLK